MKKEVEIKVRLQDSVAAAEKLSKLGFVFSDPVEQEDTIYINYDRPFIEFTPDDPFLRIRKSEGKTIFTYKQGEEMNSVEREFEVSSAEELHDTLVFLGFRPEVSVRKARRKARHGEYEVCLDEVDGLGAFIEVERITEERSEEVQAQMLKFLEDLGIDASERILNGYDTLVWLKNNPSR